MPGATPSGRLDASASAPSSPTSRQQMSRPHHSEDIHQSSNPAICCWLQKSSRISSYLWYQIDVHTPIHTQQMEKSLNLKHCWIWPTPLPLRLVSCGDPLAGASKRTGAPPYFRWFRIERIAWNKHGNSRQRQGQFGPPWLWELDRWQMTLVWSMVHVHWWTNAHEVAPSTQVLCQVFRDAFGCSQGDFHLTVTLPVSCRFQRLIGSHWLGLLRICFMRSRMGTQHVPGGTKPQRLELSLWRCSRWPQISAKNEEDCETSLDITGHGCFPSIYI